MAVNFSLDSDGGVVTQQSTLSGSGGANSFSGSGMGAGQSSGGVAGGGTDLNAFAAGERRQGMFGLGIDVDSFNKLTQGMIQPYIDRQKKEQYAQGMAQAAQGKALIDIENDQPWYTKLYGPDATVQGAQAFNVAASMQDAQSQFMQAMPQLREKSPDQVRAYVVQKMSQVQPTGDAGFDAMVQQGLAEQLPQMLKAHMSQYTQYTQEQNYNGFTNLGTQGAQSLQDTLKANNAITPDDVAAQSANFTNLLVKPDNMTDEAYQKGLRDVSLSAAQSGNWAAVRAIKAMPEYQAMNTQMKSNLEVQIPRLEEEWALKNPAARNLFTSRADLQYSLMSGQTGLDSSPAGHAQLDQMMDQMQDANEKLNGDATPVFDNNKRAMMHKLLDQGNDKKLRLIAAAQQKQLNYDQSVSLAGSAINNSNTAGLSGIPLADGAAGQAADTAFGKAVAQGVQPDIQANIFDKLSAVAHDEKFQSPQLKQVLTQQLPALLSGNGPATGDMQAALQYASQLYKGAGGAAAVSSYLGDSVGPKVVALLNSGINISDPDQLKQQRELIARGGNATATQDEVKAAQATVAQADPNWLKKILPWTGTGALSKYDLNDGNKQQLAATVAPIMAQYKKAYHMTDEQAANMAFGQVLKNADFVPGAFILHNAALGQQSFESAVNAAHPGMGAQGNANYQQAVQYVIDQQMEKYLGPKATIGQKLLGDVKHMAPDGSIQDGVTWADAQAGTVRFVSHGAGYDPSEWQVESGENLGNGYMTLFMVGPHGAMKLINITADAVGKRIQETYGHKPEHDAGDLGLSSNNAWGWAY